MSYLKITNALLLFTLIGSGWKPAENKILPVTRTGLENKNWELDEIRFQQDNKSYYYKKDDWEKSTIRFDGDYIRFETGGSGFYHQGDNKEYKIKWQFTNIKNTSIEFVIDNFRYNKPLTVHWEKIELNDTEIKYVEYYTQVTGIHSLGYGIRKTEVLDCPVGDTYTGN